AGRGPRGSSERRARIAGRVVARSVNRRRVIDRRVVGRRAVDRFEQADRPALGWRSGAGPDRLTRRARRGTPAAVHSPHPFHPPNCLPTMSLKILVVDDSPTERWFLADLIAKGGYQVTTAANGEEALEMVRSNP